MTCGLFRAEDVSFGARRVIDPPPRLHKAFASTGAVCTAAAASMEGTVVHDVAAPITGDTVRIGHPTGVFPITLKLGLDGDLVEASYSRQARRLFEVTAHIPHPVLSKPGSRGSASCG